MTEEKQLEAIEAYVHRIFEKDPTGHDYHHMKRVAKMSRKIAMNEGLDPFLSEAGGWLHDVGDRKLFNNPVQTINEMNGFLRSIHFKKEYQELVNHIIETISFKAGNTPDAPVGMVVQDADRLDAIGAIGIARVFQYGGANGQLIYEPDNPHTSIQHFYDKLLRVKDGLHTETAKSIGSERHKCLEEYLSLFFKEWD